MKVIIIKRKAFKKLEEMFIKSQDIIQEQARAITAAKMGLLSLDQVCELTGYKKAFIRSRKEEIGYHTVGRDLKFKPSAVQEWIDKYYRTPI